MKIDTNRNYYPKFGMALNIPSKPAITRMMGSKIAEDIELAKPKLKQLAEDATINIEPSVSTDLTRIGEDVFLVSVDPPKPNFDKKPVLNFFKSLLEVFHRPYEVVYPEDGNIIEDLIKAATRQKAIVHKYY